MQHENEPKKLAAYAEIRTAMRGLLSGPLVFESALSSLIALLKEKLAFVSWVGFYRLEGGELWVGPYQGPLACVSIRLDRGVCGAAASQRKTMVVEDVHAFPGHIACDPRAASEIVVPVFRHAPDGPHLIGVLDLDSHERSAFAALDQRELEALVNSIEPLAARLHN